MCICEMAACGTSLPSRGSDQCLVLRIQCPHLPSCFNTGYAGHFLGRTGDKPDGLAIFYRTEQFSVLALHEVRFKLSDDKKAVMNRDNVALVCVLSHTPTGRRLCVANTHLLYNHRRGYAWRL